MLILLIALVLDALVGDPDWLWRRLPHPIVGMGKIISLFDRWRSGLRAVSIFKRVDGTRLDLVWGAVLVLVLGMVSLLAAMLIWSIALISPWGAWAVEVLVVAAFLAQRSLYQHVAKVATALRREGLPAGRKAVAMIVGRDVRELDESGVSKAAVESLAENASDGIVAPVCWYVIGGLPGLLFYKAVNTADSMIGHRNETYEYFGKAAARIDDLMNWPAARLSSLLLMLIGLCRGGKRLAWQIWEATEEGAPRHRSPNAGWPETGFAVLLNLSLGGDRAYGDQRVRAVLLNPTGRARASADDIDLALRLFIWLCVALFGLCLALWLFSLGWR